MEPEPEPEPPVRIPPEQLTPEALHGVLEELVTRDGTELTAADAKVRQVERLLRDGEVELWFDPASKSCSLVRPGA